MLAIFTIHWALMAHSSAPPMGMPLDPSDFMEQHRRTLLAQARWGRQFVEQQMLQFERTAVQYEKLKCHEDAGAIRKHAEALRAMIPLFEQKERELLEMQPGGYTAPPPRAVKPK